MKLIERYSLALGLKIGEQFLLEAFYPMPNGIDKYITLQGSSGMVAKNYPYFSEVVLLIQPYLSKQNISIVQIGGEKDNLVPNTISLLGKTNFWQTNYIVGRSLAHVGNDSWISHRAGFLKKPLVTLFGATSVENHSAHSFDKLKTIFLSSHRNGKNPSFQSQEPNPSIALIPPEDVAIAILKNLDIPNDIQRKSLYFGNQYNNQALELVPDVMVSPTFLPESPITVRMDYFFSEQILAQLLANGRKCVIVTNKSINSNLLIQFKGNILAYNHEIVHENQPSFDYIKLVKSVINQNVFLTKEIEENKISELRLKYFDSCFIEKMTPPTKKDAVAEICKFLNKKELDFEINDDKVIFKSNKFILKGGKIYTSMAHVLIDKNITSFQENSLNIIDNQEFWKDINHYYIYKN